MNVHVRAAGLKAMREKRGLTQRQLTRELGVAENYIGAIERVLVAPGRNSSSA